MIIANSKHLYKTTLHLLDTKTQVNKTNFNKILSKYLNDEVLLNKAAQSALETAQSFKGATQKSLEVINL